MIKSLTKKILIVIINIKREIIMGEVSSLDELQSIFKQIKEESNGNIAYVSLSDENASLIISDNSDFAQAEDENYVDGKTSATSHGDVSDVVNQETTMGQI